MKIAALLSVLLWLSCPSAAQKPQVKKTTFDALGRSISIYTSAETPSLRFAKSEGLPFQEKRQPTEGEVSIFVNPAHKFQAFLGIGGAITDASSEVFAKLSPAKQEYLLKAYFNKKEGIGYSLARTTIHSCDFSSKSYTYVAEGDKKLDSFDIKPDKEFRIPLIKKAIQESGNTLRIYASPWSPPAFMKDNKNMLRGGKLLPEFYQPWANYFVKFINAYEKEGIHIWGITIQNEPMAIQRWESCIFTAEEERDFLKNHLGKTLAKAGLGKKRIIIWDHNRDLINQRVDTILADPIAAKYVWGIGFHWYEPWSGGQQMFDNVKLVNQVYPDKHLIFTEGTVESFSRSKYFVWANGERYGRSMINDFNSGTVGWTDWNILLDENGGPNHVGNFCMAPVHADTQKDELIFTPSYYYLGHFSKFIEEGAKRISSVSSRSHLLTTSFMAKDGKITTIVLNQSGEKIDYFLSIGTMASPISIPAHAIQTLVYSLK